MYHVADLKDKDLNPSPLEPRSVHFTVLESPPACSAPSLHQELGTQRGTKLTVSGTQLLNLSTLGRDLKIESLP